MPSLVVQDFRAFFAAVNDGHEPYDWQMRVVDALAVDAWPERIVAPTGAGKSALLEMHVFLRALAIQNGQSFPRRLVLCVGRRALVDAQAERAASLATLLESAESGVPRIVADLLRRDAISPDDGSSVPPSPLTVSILRGGMALDNAWVNDPVGCQVLCVTPDMLGSRLLFRGYLSSRRSWSRAAGLLAYDTAVVVDESHLNQQLVMTLRRIGLLATDSPIARALRPLQVIETTATPAGEGGTDVVVAGTDDDPALAERLRARKQLRLIELPQWPLPRSGKVRSDAVSQIVDEAVRMRDAVSGTVGVVLNRVRDAVTVAAQLQARGLHVVTLVGPMRPHDRRRLERDHPHLLTPQGDPTIDVLVATQTIEVGVDLDLHGMITDVAPAPSLVQRWGRVNRRGAYATGNGEAPSPIAVCVPTEPDTIRGAAPYPDEDIQASTSWLAGLGDGADLSAAALTQSVIPQATTPRMLLTRLTRSEAELLSRSSEHLHAEPELDLWLADSLEPALPLVSVVGRRLPSDAIHAEELIAATPPLADELFPTTIGTARAVAKEAADRLVVLIRGDEDPRAMTGTEAGEDLRPQDILILPHNLHAAAFGVVVDKEVQDRKALEDVAEVFDPATDDHVYRILLAPPESDHSDASKRLRALLAELPGAVAAIEEDEQDLVQHAQMRGEPAPVGLPGVTWEALRLKLPARNRETFGGRLHPPGVGWEATVAYPASPRPDGSYAWFAVVWRVAGSSDAEVLQEWSPAARPVTLDDHQGDVARRAIEFARALGLPDDAREPLRLAGLHHDDGKRAAAFQRRLGRRPGDPMLAKSPAAANKSQRHRASGALPRGWRHEQLSVVVAWADLPSSSRALTARLIGTSHGLGRVAFPHSASELVPPDAASLLPTAVELFDCGEWDALIADTDARWGPWGAALLEAVLRAADNTISREGR